MCSASTSSTKVSTRIKIQIPDVLPTVDTSLCTRFTDVLDYDRLNARTNRSWQYSLAGPDVQKYQNEITVREIFEYIPDVREVVARVVFRDNQSYQRLEYPGSTAYDYVRVHKYVYLEFVCYRFGIRKARTQDYSFFAVSPTAAGMIYEIYLSHRLGENGICEDLAASSANASPPLPQDPARHQTWL